MMKTIRRTFAPGLVAVATTAAIVLGGGPAAQAATGFWIEGHSDHTDIVVDWYAVPAAADDVENNLGACVEASKEVGPVWLIDQLVCMNFVEDCAEVANQNYPGHAIRVSFYEFFNECRVI